MKKVNIEEAIIKASIMASLDVMNIKYKSVNVKVDKEDNTNITIK